LTDTVVLKMKNINYIYFIVLIIIVTAIISVRTVIHKMDHSGNEVDAIFYKIGDGYKKQIELARILEFQLKKTGKVQPDSLPPFSFAASDIFQKSSKLNFPEFIKYQQLQESIDQNIDRLNHIISTGRWESESEIEQLVFNMNNNADKIELLKESYNENARRYNSFIKTFPNNFYSIFFHFQTKPYFPKKKERFLKDNSCKCKYNLK